MVSWYRLPGGLEYAGGVWVYTASSGRKPSVTMNAFALYEELVDVDHLLCGGGVDGGGGGECDTSAAPAPAAIVPGQNAGGGGIVEGPGRKMESLSLATKVVVVVKAPQLVELSFDATDKVREDVVGT